MSIDHVCPECGGPLRAQQAIYCSDKCRMKAYRKRKSARAAKHEHQDTPAPVQALKPSGRLMSMDDVANHVEIDSVLQWSEAMQKRLNRP